MFFFSSSLSRTSLWNPEDPVPRRMTHQVRQASATRQRAQVLLRESNNWNLELVLKKCFFLSPITSCSSTSHSDTRQPRTCQRHLALGCISSLCSSEVSVGFYVWVTGVASFCVHTHSRSWACAYHVVRPQGRLHRCDPRKWIGRCSGRTVGWSQRCSTPSPGPNTPKSCCPGWKSVSVLVGLK